MMDEDTVLRNKKLRQIMQPRATGGLNDAVGATAQEKVGGALGVANDAAEAVASKTAPARGKLKQFSEDVAGALFGKPKKY